MRTRAILTGGLLLWTVSSAPAARAEPWDFRNDPASADRAFELRLAKLPTAGAAARVPWPGYAWPLSTDSINFRWDGDAPSPAEKAEQGLGLSGFADAVTNRYGVYSAARPACDVSAECSALADGSVCAIPRGSSAPRAGRCIPASWSLAHGWAAAAVAERAPANAVIRNGVTFYPGDLEALASVIYAVGVPIRFLGNRCNTAPSPVDASGRMLEAQCRDVNPGSLHVVLTNMLGMRGASVIMDRTASAEVWNQPIRAYRITNLAGGRLREISRAEARALVHLDVVFTTLFTEQTVGRNEQRSGWYRAPAAGALLFRLRGTGDADLYVRKRRQATEDAYDCRPYTGGSDEECRIQVVAGESVSWMVRGFSETSSVSLDLGATNPSPSYAYNAAARKFFRVALDVDYLSSADPARKSRLGEADAHTRTDSYEYVLEVDASGNVLGGEWIGGSRSAHPDFIWWPIGPPSGTTPGGLTYPIVRSLLDESTAGR